MRHLIAAVVVFALAAFAPPAFAGYEDSRNWFESLPADERSTMQADLTLLGYYQFLVDGQFGNGTYQAITAYQGYLGRARTGVLLDRDKSRLADEAIEIYTNLGMDLIRDKEGQAAMIMPVGLLTAVTPAERGNTYATPDGGITLTTARRPIGETSFQALFDELSTPGGGRYITFSNFNGDRFVVTGVVEGKTFYAMFQNAEVDSVGYTLTWNETDAELAQMLAIFIASHFTALRYMPEEGEEVRIAEVPGSESSFGIFSLPTNSPDVIFMNGEVSHTLGADFEQALKVRPKAKILVLNSPGGYVNNALQVATEVRRRGMGTVVASGMGCYSACAYIFFAGSPRYAEGELGVHQISSEVKDLVMAQTTLGDVLDALDSFGVAQEIISVMLRTPPEAMHVFTTIEISRLSINEGDPIHVADLSVVTTTVTNTSTKGPVPGPGEPIGPTTPGAAYVELALQNTEAFAQMSLQYAIERWAGLLGDATPEIVGADGVFHVRVPARSVESANALCAAIKSAGGGCYITQT